MKKKIIIGIIVILVIGIGIYFVTKKDEPVIQINELKTSLNKQTYDDIIYSGYNAIGEDEDHIILMSREPKMNIFIRENNANDKIRWQLGVVITDKITTLKLDDHDLLKMSKEEIINEFGAIEIVDLVNFEYQEDYFVCLKYVDNKLTDFVIVLNVNGYQKLRNTDIFYEKSQKYWQEEVEAIW